MKFDDFLENRKNYGLLLSGFAILLVLFALFSNQLHFHDTPEYITLAKSLIKYDHTSLYITHSLIYPFILGSLLKIWPSIIMLKLVNLFWLFLISLVFIAFTKDKKAFLLWIFSPLIWFMGIQISPILPTAFLLILGYFLMKKFEKTNKKNYLLLSGLSFGLTLAIYFAAIFFIALFILFYFYKRPLKELIFFLIAFLIAFSLELLLDQIIFGFPLYTLIRTIGLNLIVVLGLHQAKEQAALQILTYGLSLQNWILLFIIISPLTFYIFKINFKEYYKEFFLIIISLLFYVLRGADIKYLLIFSPFVILLLSKSIKNKKTLLINGLLSFFIILYLISPFFGNTQDSQVISDLNNIHNDFKDINEFIAISPLYLDMLEWDNKDMEYIWYEEYQMSQNNQTVFRDYKYVVHTPENYYNDMVLDTYLQRKNNANFENVDILISAKHDIPEGFKPIKEYQVLVVSKKI